MPGLRPGTPTPTERSWSSFESYEAEWPDGLPHWDGGVDDAEDFLQQIDAHFFQGWDGRDANWNDPRGLVIPLLWILGQEWGLSLREINRLMHIMQAF